MSVSKRNEPLAPFLSGKSFVSYVDGTYLWEYRETGPVFNTLRIYQVDGPERIMHPEEGSLLGSYLSTILTNTLLDIKAAGIPNMVQNPVMFEGKVVTYPVFIYSNVETYLRQSQSYNRQMYLQTFDGARDLLTPQQIEELETSRVRLSRLFKLPKVNRGKVDQ